MGSWNETCMVSNLPVMYGEPVICYLIKKSKYFDQSIAKGVYTTTDLFCPVSLPIKAVYNDYGGVSEADNIAFNHANNIEKIDSFPNDNNKDYALVFIKENIYRSLIDRSKIKLDKYSARYLAEKVKGWIDHVKIEISLPLVARMSMRSGEEDRVYDLIKSLSQQELSDQDIIHITNLLNEDYLFNMILGRLRKFWMPTGNKGSQNINYYEHLVLIEAMRNSINKEILNDDTASIYLQLMGLRDY